MIRKALLAVALVMLLTSPALAADVIKMDCNAIYGAGNFHTKGAVKFAELAKKYTNGSVEITVHPGGSLGFKGPELLKTVKDGTLPMSDILMGVVSGSDQIFSLSTLPMMLNSYKEAKAFYDASKPFYEKACEKWNQKLLYAAPWPRSGLYTKKALSNVADLKGLKIRTYDKLGAEFLTMAGASPQSLPWGEVYTALSTGLIESVLTSSTSGVDGKFWEVLKNFTKINYSYPLNMVTINMDYWKALNKEQQAALLKAAAETEVAQWAASQKSVVDSIKVLEEKGMAVSEMTPELAKELGALATKMREDFKKNSSASCQAAMKAAGK